MPPQRLDAPRASPGHITSADCDATVQSGIFFFSSRRRHTRLQGDWSSDVCSSDLYNNNGTHDWTVANNIFVGHLDRKSTRLNSSHLVISYAVFCLKKQQRSATDKRPVRALWGERELVTPWARR